MECVIADDPNSRPTPILINHIDLKNLNINDNDIVKVYNDRGSCLARAKSSHDIREGVVALQTGAWFETGEDGTELQGNPNILTLDVGTSRIGQGSSAHTTLINISKYNN